MMVVVASILHESSVEFTHILDVAIGLVIQVS
jgi:hypothetical protein